tara:strand:- start:313 stop:492 length:180 start_codon:yes stop_codon:yes gene_type:complete
MQFIRKTSSSSSLIKFIIKLIIFLFIVLGLIFLLNKIDFPAPNKEIEKVIPNENFKIVK